MQSVLKRKERLMRRMLSAGLGAMPEAQGDRSLERLSMHLESIRAQLNIR